MDSLVVDLSAIGYQFSMHARTTVLSVTTFWSFLREFSPLEVCGDENNRALLSGELPIGLHVPLHLSIGQAHAGDGRISSECELWKSFLHHHICGSPLHRENSTGISLNLRISHGKVARTRAENSRMF
jgi:hypothetical protein